MLAMLVSGEIFQQQYTPTLQCIVCQMKQQRGCSLVYAEYSIKRDFNFRINYIGTLKTVFTNRAFVIMFFVLGGNMSFISTLATKMEQIMCR